MKAGSLLPRHAPALLLAALALAACGGDAGRARPVARNLLFVSLDTTRADHLACYGYERETSPRLDALAAAGHRFDEAHTVMPTTLPSHAAMFTSLFPRELGVWANGVRVPPSAFTLAERLSEQGFATGAFVSAVPLDPRLGLDQGFDVYDAPPPGVEERRGDVTRARAAAWLDQRAGERFFCFVHLFDPHTWYTPPEPQRVLFGAPTGQQPPARDFLPDRAAFTPEVRRGAIDAYDAEIRFADEQLGLLLDELDRLGALEDTLVVVLSDHGEALDELIDAYGYGFDHGEFLHRRELRIPLVLSLPSGLGLAGGRVHPELVSTLDLLPTLLELLGVECAQPFLGRSLVPLLAGGTIESVPVLAERRRLTRGEVLRPPSHLLRGGELAVATASWQFVRCEGRPLELYDLAGGRLETPNVAAEHPDVVARMAELLEAWEQVHAAAGPAGQGPVDPELLRALRALGYATAEDGE